MRSSFFSVFSILTAIFSSSSLGVFTVICLTTAISVSLMLRTKSCILSGNIPDRMSTVATSLRPTWRMRNTARGASVAKCSSLARI